MNTIANSNFVDYLTSLQQLVNALIRWKPIITDLLVKDKSLVTFDWIINEIICGRLLFFNNDDAFMIIQPQQYPLGLTLHVLFAGGNKENVLLLKEDVNKFAKSVDAKKITVLGRKGFSTWKEMWPATGQIWYAEEL